MLRQWIVSVICKRYRMQMLIFWCSEIIWMNSNFLLEWYFWLKDYIMLLVIEVIFKSHINHLQTWLKLQVTVGCVNLLPSVHRLILKYHYAVLLLICFLIIDSFVTIFKRHIRLQKNVFISLLIDIFQKRGILVISDVGPNQHFWIFYDSYQIDIYFWQKSDW
jgi:hypothetical protein